jgi:hypothetical protein
MCGSGDAEHASAVGAMAFATTSTGDYFPPPAGLNCAPSIKFRLPASIAFTICDPGAEGSVGIGLQLGDDGVIAREVDPKQQHKAGIGYRLP